MDFLFQIGFLSDPWIHIVSSQLTAFSMPFPVSRYLSRSMSVCTRMCACSVMSDSLQHYELQPSSLLTPWDFPGKNTGVGCHFLLHGIFPTQASYPCLLSLLQWQADSLPLSHLGRWKSLSRVRLFATPAEPQGKSQGKPRPFHYHLSKSHQSFMSCLNHISFTLSQWS